MELVTDDIRATLLENGARYRQDSDFDPVPGVKFFMPDAAATWLIISATPKSPPCSSDSVTLASAFPKQARST